MQYNKYYVLSQSLSYICLQTVQYNLRYYKEQVFNHHVLLHVHNFFLFFLNAGLEAYIDIMKMTYV